jgi:hypothetical protein
MGQMSRASSILQLFDEQFADQVARRTKSSKGERDDKVLNAASAAYLHGSKKDKKYLDKISDKDDDFDKFVDDKSHDNASDDDIKKSIHKKAKGE